MTRINEIVFQINELNNELEKLRLEFEELWNAHVALFFCLKPGDWVTMENFIGAFAVLGNVVGDSYISRGLLSQFPGLFENKNLNSPHTKRTMQPYLRWVIQRTIEFIKEFRETNQESDLAGKLMSYELPDLYLLTRIHSILKDKKKLRREDYDHQTSPHHFYNKLIRYKIDDFTFKSFEENPEAERSIYRKKAKLLYKKSSVRVIEIRSQDAAIYFGQKTDPKWCISTTNLIRNQYEQYAYNSHIFIVIDTKEQRKFCIILNKKNGGVVIWDERNETFSNRGVDRFFEHFPEVFNILESFHPDISFYEIKNDAN